MPSAARYPYTACAENPERIEPLPSVVLRNDSRKPRFELKFSPASFLLFVSVTFVLSVPHKSSAQLNGKSCNGGMLFSFHKGSAQV